MSSLLDKFGLAPSPEQFELNRSKKVVVGMSGGVDSSVTALLLKQQGFQVLGMYMKNWEDDGPYCTSEKDYRDVVAVCERLEIDYYSVNFSKQYWNSVFDTFLNEYKMGHTPNPDILCNREIKFNVFFKHAIELGADYLATGHYCQRTFGDAPFRLLKGRDPKKDQSYFLYTMKDEVLKKVLFPIGGLLKSEVRELASAFHLETSHKKDSTGICFIGERDFKDFLSSYIQKQKGEFKTLDGEVVGHHDGACFYTSGQRKGLGLGGQGEPWFVVGKDIHTNTVYVERGEFHPALYVDGLTATELSFVNNETYEFLRVARSLKCKVRYRQSDQDCVAQIDSNGQLNVQFPCPQRAVALRQSVVLYNGDECLGGGIISDIGPDYFHQKKDLPPLI